MPEALKKREPAAIERTIAALAARFGNKLVTSEAVRRQHANTTTWLDNEPPDAVVFAASTEDVQGVVGICAEHRVPIIPFGTGTSLEGHVNAPLGGVSHRPLEHEPGARRSMPRTSTAWSSRASRASS